MCESYHFPSLHQRNLLIHSTLLSFNLFIMSTILGLSSTMNVRIVYLDIMRPFAESVLLG